MNEQVSSDSLSTLKARAELALQLGKGAVVDASMALALVECAEVLKDIDDNRRIMASGGCECSDCQTARRMESAIAKLEAL
jgi:hypothetical protein